MKMLIPRCLHLLFHSVSSRKSTEVKNRETTFVVVVVATVLDFEGIAVFIEDVNEKKNNAQQLHLG